MNPKEHSFKFYSDPAHGWLEMPLKVIKELEMEMFQISEFSYYDKKTDFVYVEQDCDLINVKTILKFYNSNNSLLDEKLKSDIIWFGTGLTPCEFEACKLTAEDYFKKGYKGDEL